MNTKDRVSRSLRLTFALAFLAQLFAGAWVYFPPMPQSGWQTESNGGVVALSPDGTILCTSEWESGQQDEAKVQTHFLQATDGTSRSQSLSPVILGTRHGLVFSPDGRLMAGYASRTNLLMVSDDAAPGQLIVWDVASGRQRAKITIPNAILFAEGIRFPAGGHCLLLIVGIEGDLGTKDRVCCLDLEIGEERWSLSLDERQSAHLSADGERFAVCDLRSRRRVGVQFWHRVNERGEFATDADHTLDYEGKAVDRVQVSSDLRTAAMVVASDTEDQGDHAADELMIWDLETGARLGRFPNPKLLANHPPFYSAFSADGSTLCFTTGKQGSGDASQIVVAGVHERPIRVRTSAVLPDSTWDLDVSPDGKWVSIPKSDGLDVWDTETFTLRSLRHVGDKGRTNMRPRFLGLDWDQEDMVTYAIAPDSRTVVVKDLQHDYPDSLLDEWRAGRYTLTAPTHLHDVVRVWDVASGTELLELPDCATVVFSPDGKHLAAVDEEGHVSVWDVPPRRPWAKIMLTTAGLWLGVLMVFGIGRAWLRWLRGRRNSQDTPATSLTRCGTKSP